MSLAAGAAGEGVGAGVAADDVAVAGAAVGVVGAGAAEDFVGAAAAVEVAVVAGAAFDAGRRPAPPSILSLPLSPSSCVVAAAAVDLVAALLAVE